MKNDIVVPRNIIIDISNKCNLRCETCVQGRRIHEQAERNMTYEEFRYILYQLKGFIVINHNKIDQKTGLKFYSWAEPFLNDSYSNMVNLAKQFGYTTIVSTNLNISPKIVIELQNIPIDVLIVTVSGFNQHIYSINHKAGDINIVKENLVEILNNQKKFGYPKIVKLRYLIAPWNLKDIYPFKHFFMNLPGNKEFVTNDGPLRVVGRYYELGQFPYDQKYMNLKRHSCFEYQNVEGFCKNLHERYQLVIRADGEVFPCCAIQYEKRFSIGNILKEDILHIWKSERFKKLRFSKLIGDKSICFNAWKIP